MWQGCYLSWTPQPCLSALQPFFGDLLGFLGAIATGPTTFWLPPLMWLLLYRPNLTNVRLHPFTHHQAVSESSKGVQPSFLEAIWVSRPWKVNESIYGMAAAADAAAATAAEAAAEVVMAAAGTAVAKRR